MLMEELQKIGKEEKKTAKKTLPIFSYISEPALSCGCRVIRQVEMQVFSFSSLLVQISKVFFMPLM